MGKLKISRKGDKIVRVDGTIECIIFEEDNYVFVYSPEFDVVGYGDDEAEAHESFRYVLYEFLSYSIEKKTFIPFLEKQGWEVKKRVAKAPALVKLANLNKEVSRVLQLDSYRKSQDPVSLAIA